MRVERETDSDTTNSIPPPAQVRLCEGNRFVLVTTKEEVILSLPCFVKYKHVPFVSLSTSILTYM